MAVAGPCPAMHTSHRKTVQQLPELRPSYQTQPFDPAVLCRKLEIAKREQSAAWQRYKQQQAVHNGAYTPRFATKQFACTTTSAKDLSAAFQQQANQQSQPRQPLVVIQNSVAHKQPQAKHIFALKELGMSSTEALLEASGQGLDIRRHTDSGLSRPAKLDDTEEHTSAGAAYRPGDARRRNTNNPSSRPPPPRQHDQQRNDEKVKRSTSRGAAKTDKDAKRNKRASNYVAIKHGSQTTYELRPEAATEGYKPVFAAEEDDEDEERAGRPRLRHDRPDWAQQSTCGDEARDLFHLLHLHKKHAEDEPAAPAQQQQHSQLHQQGRRGSPPMRDNLISDAVKIIKEEKKDLRKQRISGFFKRGDKTPAAVA